MAFNQGIPPTLICKQELDLREVLMYLMNPPTQFSKQPETPHVLLNRNLCFPNPCQCADMSNFCNELPCKKQVTCSTGFSCEN